MQSFSLMSSSLIFLARMGVTGAGGDQARQMIPYMSKKQVKHGNGSVMVLGLHYLI
jgi:hypothetical protein